MHLGQKTERGTNPVLSVLSFSTCQYLAKLSTQAQTLPSVTWGVFSFLCYTSLYTNSQRKTLQLLMIQVVFAHSKLQRTPLVTVITISESLQYINNFHKKFMQYINAFQIINSSSIFIISWKLNCKLVFPKTLFLCKGNRRLHPYLYLYFIVPFW